MRRVTVADGPVRVPRVVLDGIDAVRESGLTNMLNRPLVAELAATLGYAEAAEWIREHGGEYANGVFHGFEPLEKKGRS